MKIEIVNPSPTVCRMFPEVSLQWEQTCHSATCSHASHDAGYNFLEVEVEENERLQSLVYTPATVHCHGSTDRKSGPFTLWVNNHDESFWGSSYLPQVFSRSQKWAAMYIAAQKERQAQWERENKARKERVAKERAFESFKRSYCGTRLQKAFDKSGQRRTGWRK